MARTNILLITSDQHHWEALGYVNPAVKTPNLDRLAREGTVFTRAYCPNPTCTPTRASMITGTYPSQHGAYALGTMLPESELTVGQVLSAAGYRTALVGKAHFQPTRSRDGYKSLEATPEVHDWEFWKKFNGPFYGFEHVELARNHTDEGHVGQHYALWMEASGLPDWRDHFRPPGGRAKAQKHKWSLPEKYHYNTWIAERSEALLESYQEKNENFFLWASFFDPHPSYLAPEPWDTMYDPDQVVVPGIVPGEHDGNPPHFQMTQEEKPDFSAWREPDGNAMHGFCSHLHQRQELAANIAVYYGMVSLLDKYIGRILDQLEALGLADNTLVVFTTDHGHFFGQHGLIAKGPFHYEDMIKVPFIVKLPGRVEAGKESAALQSLVDLPPTFLDVAGVEIPRVMTGCDQRKVWFGVSERVRDHIIVENRHQPTTIHVKTYVDERYKLTVYYHRDYGELFDLEEDPREVNNLWPQAKYAGLKTDLLLKLVHAEMGKEPLWMPRIAGA